MNIRPRFRAGTSKRPFVDREEFLQAFETLCSRNPESYHVLNLYGIGGIGKSRLLAHLAECVPIGSVSALLDLHIPSMRQHMNALASLRLTYGRQGVCFDRFDLGFAVLWRRLNPTIELSLKNQTLIIGSEILTDIASSTGGLPLVGTASKLLQVVGGSVHRWHHLSNDDVLAELDNLQLDELTDAVTYLLVRDLRSDDTKHPVLFIDAYEALIGGLPLGANRAADDNWLRDLVAQMRGCPIVIASREPIDWEIYNSAWSREVLAMELHGLPDWARLELLRSVGLEDSEASKKISSTSEGVPYFLLLSADSGPTGDGVMTREAILERFLQHVDASYVRALELLSIARVFTKDMYDELAKHFGLPRDSFAWNCISSYSFVVPAGDFVRLHRLMATSLVERLSLQARIQAHQILATYWLNLASCQSSKPNVRADAYMEAAYHAINGQWPIESLLDIADRLTGIASPSGVRGIISDLGEFISITESQGDLSSLKAFLDAEIMLLHGQTSSALQTLDLHIDDISSLSLLVRLHLTRGHCLRILGRTSEALQIYMSVWENQSAKDACKIAGHWVADLQMAMGDFAGCLGTVDTLLSSDDSSYAFLYRLKHLAYRFSFEYRESQEFLAQAIKCTHDDVVCEANLMTNRIELDALVNPESALEGFNEALTAQSILRAEPELGKLYCAKALANLKLGQLDECADALANSVKHLERAGYQSGLGRAFLYQAALSARLGSVPDAVQYADKAIKIFLDAEVYPTLVVLAVKLCESIGQLSPERTQAELSARSRIHLPCGADDLDDRIKRLGLFYPEFESLLIDARNSTDKMSGFYNENIRVGEFVVRTRLKDAPVMDLTIWQEADVLAVAYRYTRKTPRLLSLFREESAQVHEFVHGNQLDQLMPKGHSIPKAWSDQIISFLNALQLIPKFALPPTPEDWPEDGDSIGFAHKIEQVTRRTVSRYKDTHLHLWRSLGIPESPLDVLEWEHLGQRSHSLIHCDIHRKNILVTPGERLIFLDWELALWGDPLYDLAVHIHKMDYPDHQAASVISSWAYLMKYDHDLVIRDLRTYLCHERIKSALVDSVRYFKIVGEGVPAKRVEELSSVLARKLNRAREAWGIVDKTSPQEVSMSLLQS